VTHWFDTRAARPNALTPERQHKVDLIKEALAKSNVELHSILHSILDDEAAALHVGPQPSFGGRLFSDISVRSRAQLGDEMLRARARLAALHTGLQAERQLRDSLTESAAGAAAWARALSTDNGLAIAHAQTAMTKHFANADRLARAGLTNLEKGR
jgi:hypothetical protein